MLLAIPLHLSGNIGIGTTTPTCPLDVYGGLTLNSLMDRSVEFATGTQDIRSLSVSGDGNTAVLSVANNNNTNTLRVYNKEGGTWVQNTLTVQNLPADIYTGYPYYRKSGARGQISKTGTRILAIKGIENGAGNANVAEIFHKVGNAWQSKAYIHHVGALGWGYAISGDGNTVALTAPFDNNNNYLGTIYVYKYNSGTDTWDQSLSRDYDNWPEQITLNYDGTLLAFSRSGIPADQNDLVVSSTASVHILKYINGAWNAQNDDIIITPPTDIKIWHYFGKSLQFSSDGKTLVVGAPGFNEDKGVYDQLNAVFVYKSSNGLWTTNVSSTRVQPASYTNPTSDNYVNMFGNALNINDNGTILVVGAARADVNGVFDQGQVYLFQLIEGSWSNIATFDGTSGEEALFGTAVAIINDNRIFVSARGWTTPATQARVTVFDVFTYGKAIDATGDAVIKGTLDVSSHVTIAGNIGVGTTSPLYPMEITSSYINGYIASSISYVDYTQWDAYTNRVDITPPSRDDYYAQLPDFGFDFLIGGINYRSSSFVGTNSYISFGSYLTAYYNINNNGTIALLIGADDNYVFANFGISYYSGNYNGNQAMYAFFYGYDYGNPSSLYEWCAVLQSNNKIDVFMKSINNNAQCLFGIGNGDGTFLVQLPENGTFPAITGVAYTLQPSIIYNQTALNIHGYISVDGRIGIGKTQPEYPLDVDGTVQATSITANKIVTTGNVGIGNINPQYHLHVNGTAYATSFIGDGSQLTNVSAAGWIGDSTNAYITKNVGIGTATPFAKTHIYHDGSGDILRVDDSAGPSTPFIINQDGKVGISTSSPSASLHVNGTCMMGLGTELRYPPAALNANTTSLVDVAYGNGTYITSASHTTFGDQPFYLFDYNDDNTFHQGETRYNGGYTFNSPATSTDFKDFTNTTQTILGEWIQIQLPEAIILSRYAFKPRYGFLDRPPRAFVVLGSSDGTTWYLLDDHRTNIVIYTNDNDYVFKLDPVQTTPYMYYRLVTNAIGAGTYVNFNEWKLYSGADIALKVNGTVGIGKYGNTQIYNDGNGCVIHGNRYISESYTLPVGDTSVDGLWGTLPDGFSTYPGFAAVDATLHRLLTSCAFFTINGSIPLTLTGYRLGSVSGFYGKNVYKYGPSQVPINAFTNNNFVFYFEVNKHILLASSADYSSNVPQAHFAITMDGNVGIGTTAPLAKTHIYHTGTGDIFRVDDSSAPDTTPFIINETGNIGIGTTNPLEKLHIAGGMYIQGSIVPAACNVFDLGSSNYRFRDIYLSGNTIDIEGTKIMRNATTGGITFKDNTNELLSLTSQGLILQTSNTIASIQPPSGAYYTASIDALASSSNDSVISQWGGFAPLVKGPTYKEAGGYKGVSAYASFDRTSNNVLSRSAFELTLDNGFTIALLCKFTGSPTSSETIVDIGNQNFNELTLYRQSTSTNFNLLHRGSYSSTIFTNVFSIPQNEWVQVILRGTYGYSNSASNLLVESYFNGDLITSNTQNISFKFLGSQESAFGGSRIYAGTSLGSKTQFNGDIVAFSFYNYSLTDNQIFSLHKSLNVGTQWISSTARIENKSKNVGIQIGAFDNNERMIQFDSIYSTDYAYTNFSCNVGLTFGINDRNALNVGLTGNIGIGTTTPATALVVNGTIRNINGPAPDSGTSLVITANGDIAPQSSDARYKTNVEDLPPILSTLMSVRPVSYNWKDEPQKWCGLLAQEVAQVIPSAAWHDLETDTYGVHYTPTIVTLLLKGLQELNATVHELKARVQQLENP